MSAHYDVVIVGGGIAGLSLASTLAGQCSVALIEAEQTLAYHTSARSARQLIPSYGPPVVQELTVRTLELIAAQDAERPEPVLTPRSFMLIGDDATVRAEASGHMHRITHAEALDLCPVLVPDSFSAAGLDTGSFACNAPVLLEDHRRLAVAGGVDIITGARVHSAQRLGTGWELGAGQEGFQSAVVVNVQMSENDPFDIARAHAKGTQLRTDLLLGLDPERNFPTEIRMQRLAGLEQMRTLPAVDHDHAFAAVDGPCIGR